MNERTFYDESEEILSKEPNFDWSKPYLIKKFTDERAKLMHHLRFHHKNKNGDHYEG